MSRAFTKEDTDGIEDLPDRPVSPERNIVTETGFKKIDAEISRLNSEMARARAAEDAHAIAHALRDLRYWTERRESAEIAPLPDHTEEVTFGLQVTLEYEDGRRKTFRITGIDEADPAQGLISYISPLARDLIGKGTGEFVTVGRDEVEIVEIAI